MLTTVLMVNAICTLGLLTFTVRQKLQISTLEKKLQSFDQRIKLENSASHGMGLQLHKLRSDINQKIRLLRNQVIASDLSLKEKQMRRGTKTKAKQVSYQEQQLLRKMRVTA